MVKRTTIRQRVSKKEGKKSTEKDDSSPLSDGLSAQMQVENVSSLRLKRKVRKKMKFLSKLQETQQILSVKPGISKRRRGQKKSALNSLSSLADVLPILQDTTKEGKATNLPKKKQGNARRNLVVHETKQLSKVLEHPEFKSDPFSAIQQHLAKTLRSPQEDTMMKSATKAHSKKRRHKQKKKVLEL